MAASEPGGVQLSHGFIPDQRDRHGETGIAGRSPDAVGKAPDPRAFSGAQQRLSDHLHAHENPSLACRAGSPPDPL
jgi:hypothetical protein